MGKRNHRSVCFPNKPLSKWICKDEHSDYAEKLEQFLDDFGKSKLEERKLALKVWDARCHEKGKDYTCWYVSFLDANRNKRNNLCIVLHFNIVKNTRRTDIDVFFRFMDCVKKDKLKLIDWHKANENCEYVSFNKNKDKLANAVMIYLTEVRKRFDNDTLRKYSDFRDC
jgi:hypothetical protein